MRRGGAAQDQQSVCSGAAALAQIISYNVANPYNYTYCPRPGRVHNNASCVGGTMGRNQLHRLCRRSRLPGMVN
jgi:hypothetical protein